MARKTSFTALTLAVALFSAAVPALSADSAAYTGALTTFLHALGGDTDAIAPAVKQWQAVLDSDPADPVARAYTGAATSMQAKTTMLPWRKLSYAEDGLALIDKSLAMLAPAHDAAAHQGIAASLEVRYVAATTFLSLPGMFNRNERGAKLLAEVLHSPLLAAAPTGFSAAVWMTAAREALKAQRLDEARQWLGKVAASGAPQATAAQAQLKAL